LEFPPKPEKQPNNQQLDGTDFYILHVTDIHFDPNYTIGANADCKRERERDRERERERERKRERERESFWNANFFKHKIKKGGEPICCRPDDGPTKRPAAFWGDYNCDLNENMFVSFFEFVSKMQPQPNAIVYTGDSAPHNIWAQSVNGQIQRNSDIANLFQTYLPNIPLFPSLGNHESKSC